MSQHRIRGRFGMLAIAVLAVAFLFPGVAHAAVGGTVTGTVVDGAAVGIEGITVVPISTLEGRWVEQWDLQAVTTAGGSYELTLPTGEFRFRFIDTQGLVTATLGEKYYAYKYYPDANWVDAGTSLAVELDGSYSLGETVLNEGATISGTVTADDGGDTLLGIHAVAHVQFGGGFPGVQEGTTDASGNYTIVGLPPGTYVVRFWDQDNGAYASEFYNDQPDWRVDLADKFVIGGPATSLADIDAQLAAACSISGTVTDAGIASLNGAIVRLSAFNPDGGYWMWAAETRTSGDTGTDGWYRFSGLRAGVYRLMVEGPDGSYASECYNDKPPLPVMGDDIVVGGAMSADATADVALAPAGYITGHVRQEGSGDPIADLPVNACIDRDGWYEAVAWASTDSNGLYTIGHMATGTYYVQFIGASGWVGEIYNDQRDWWSADGVSVVAGLTTTLDDAYLTAGASAEGYVYAPDGTTPLSGMAVTPVRRVDYGDGNIGHEERGDLTYYTDIDPLGHFRIEGLEPGDWALRIYDPSGMYAAQFQDGELIPSNAFFRTIASGETWSVPNIVLSEAGTINGTVYDDGEPGTPLEGITVAAWIPIGGGYEWIVSDQTDSAGYYELLGVMPGEVYLEFQGNMQWLGEYWSDDPVGGTRDRMLADPVTVTAGLTATFDTHLEAAAIVAGHVTTDGGTTDLANISVVPMQLEGDGFNTWWNHRWDLQDQTDEAGLFEVGGLTPGTWSLMYTDPSGLYATEYWNEQSLQSQVDMFDITGGGLQPGSYDADLEPGCEIAGTVYGATEPEPTALANMGVSANVDRGNWYESVAWTNTGPDGSYTLTGMQTGTYFVEFYGDADWMGQFYSDTYPGTRDWMQATGLAITPDEPASGINALLQAAAQITGHVSTNDGDVIADAEGIQVIPLQYNEGSQRWEYQWHLSAMTDSVGDYTIGGLDFTDYKIVFQDPNGQWATEFYHDTSSPLDALLVGVTTDTWVANEELVPGNTITGTVTGYVAASDSVEPLEGIGIAAGPCDDEGYYEHITWANTGIDGTFELRGLPAGSFKVQFWDESGAYVSEFYNDTTDFNAATPVAFAGTGQSQDLGTIDLDVAARLTGHVTNGVGDLAGIDVVPMYWRDDGEGGGWWEERWDLARQTSDDGTFTLTGLTPSVEPDVVIMFQDPSGMYAKEYYDDASTPGDALRLKLDPGPNLLPDVVLEQANHISGTVTSDGATGIGGVTVAAGPYDPGTGQYEHIAWAMTSSEPGSEGTYDLGGLPAGSYVVQFWDDAGTFIDQFYSESEPATRDIAQATPIVFAGSGETRTGIDAQMVVGAMVTGVIKELGGTTPFPGIDVVPVVWIDTGEGDGWWEQQWWRSTQTNDLGEFQLTGFEPGETIRLLFQDPSGMWAYEYYDDALTVDTAVDIGPLLAGDNPLGPISLDEANHIIGTVTSAGGPLGEIMVAAGIYDRDTDYYEHVSWTMTSSEEGLEGTYDLGGLPPGSYIIQFWDDLGNYSTKFYDGTAQGTTDWAASLPVEFAGNGGVVTGVDAYLDPAARVSGTVYGDGGAGPLGGIDVEIYTFNGEWWDHSGWVQTQEDGTYNFGGFADGTVCRLWFSDWTGTWAAEAYADASSWQWGDDVTASIDTPAEGVDVTLSHAGSITGIVSGDGVPLVGAPVAAGPYDPDTDTWDPYFFTETDESGSYTFPGLKPGVAYLVQAGDYSGTYAWTMWTSGGTGTDDWHTGDDVFVEAPPADPTVCDFDLVTGGYITGHVENEAGESLAGVNVMLFTPTEVGWDDWWGSFRGMQGMTDENGNYRVGGLYPGDYRIAFTMEEGSGYASEYYNDQPILSMGTTITVTALGEEVPVEDAVLSAAGTIEGTVYDDGDPGTPLEGIEVRVVVATDETGGWRELEVGMYRTDEFGHYSIGNIRQEDDVRVYAFDPMGGYAEEWWQEATGFDTATALNAPQTGIDFTLGPPDIEAPAIDITVDPATPDGENGWYVTAPAITLTTDDPTATIWYHWGSDAPAEYAEPIEPPAGTATLTFWASDPVGNESEHGTRDFKYDPLPPDAPLTMSVSQTGPTEVTATWGVSLDEDSGLSHYELWTSSDGTAWGLEADDIVGESHLLEGLESGDLYVKVAAVDMAGNTSLYSPSDYVWVDADAPETTAIVAPAAPDGANGWYVTATSITLSCDDPEASTWYRWGADEFVEYATPLTAAEGTSTLTYYSEDAIGNAETHKTLTVKVDTAAPAQVTNLSAIAVSESAIDLEWDVATDETSGVWGYRIYQDGSFVTTVTATAYQATVLTPDTLYSFTVSAYDRAGNEGLESASADEATFADTTAPTTAIEVDPATPDGQNGWYTQDATITLTPSEPATTWWQWADSIPTEYSAGFKLPLGENVLTYWSVDASDNIEDPKPTRTFKLDKTAPGVPGGFTAERSGATAVTLTWTASSDAESGIASYTYTQTGPQSGSGLIGGAQTTYTINALPDGTYTFNLRARNAAGLLSMPTATLTVVIDTTAPVTTASTAPSEPDGTNGWFKTVPTITLSSTAPDIDSIVYRWGAGVEVTYTTGFQPPVQGTSTLWWRGTDDYGNVEAWKSQAFKVDSVAPAAPGGVEGMATGQTTASFWWSAVAGDTSGIARYRVYRNGSVADEVLGTSFDAAGLTPGTTYSFTVRAIDLAGNEGPLSEPVSVTTDAPTLYTVTFRDWDGTVLKSEEVAEGGAATAPADPTRTGYTFAGWDVGFGVVTSDLTVTATYTYDGVAWETIGDVDYARVAGALRFDTAAQSALDAFPAGASTAVIAYGRDFPDALAASPLAGAVNGPILLTETATLPQATADALTDLGVTKVYIVGGTGVVSSAVEAAIQALGVSEIERLSGANRYITAREIADEAVALGASTAEAFLVRGDDFADALAVSSIAAQEKVPVLLTTTATLHTEARGFLTATGTDDVYIAGGTGVVSAAVQAEVDALPGVAVERWYGDNRYLTGAAVVRNAMTTWAIPMVDIGLASGENFPDALAGGAVMGYKHGLLLLTQPTVLSAPTATLITENKATIESVEFFGGTGALAPAIPTTVQQLLQ